MVIATVLALGRGLRRWVLGPAYQAWFRSQVSAVVEPMLADILSELRPNDGSSLRDKVDAIEQAVTDPPER